MICCKTVRYTTPPGLLKNLHATHPVTRNYCHYSPECFSWPLERQFSSAICNHQAYIEMLFRMPKRERNIAKEQVQGNKLNNYSEEISNSRTSLIVALSDITYLLQPLPGGLHELRPGSLTGPMRVMSLVEAFTRFAKSSTSHVDPSSNHYLPRKSAYRKSGVLWVWVTRDPIP